MTPPPAAGIAPTNGGLWSAQQSTYAGRNNCGLLKGRLFAQSITNEGQSSSPTTTSDIYMALAILEDRIEGRLPAIEGIGIVKVRKAVVSTLPNAVRTRIA